MDYKKILEGVVDIINTAEKSDIGFANICTYIGKNCPELKESEGERIRKALIGWINLEPSTSFSDTFDGFSKEEILAWLEKQGNKDKLIKELGEYKVKYTQEVLKKYINSMSNKDDERLRKTAIAFLKEFADKGYENAVECIDWLEKQGEQKPAEWSEEDEKAINDIMWIIEAYRKNGFNETHIQIADSSENWLKHLKERVFTQPKQEWKPSEEQMEALDSATENCACSEHQDCLRELLRQLKKLREE